MKCLYYAAFQVGFTVCQSKLIGVTSMVCQTINFELWFVCLFGLMLNVPVNSYGHVRTVSSPNHTFFLGKLD